MTTVLSLDAASEIQAYLKSHALPEGGYLLVEQTSDASIPFSWEEFPLRVKGSIDTSSLSVSADAQVYVPIKGWTTIAHIAGSLKTGVSVSVNVLIAKGTITIKIENYQGADWLTLILDLTVLGSYNFSKTIHLFKVPFATNVQSNGISAGISKEWLEQLRLFSQLALAEKSLPAVSTTA
ncbi:hypothetical protein SISSUDRAFT_1031970 [Sistotremastrum suecicum HHB10207 ss-3]|uniref:Uncharacterized protein n=1 Tax=Sistotremastrum suecicum HHB10207 ss-3 TaxID=1314776 RepID=A0A166F9A6_9AGAM|nr:hypothetical protein SISSUDRAFT_1031970 [Sistotremastrum suecicum HHB10207 ss-3]